MVGFLTFIGFIGYILSIQYRDPGIFYVAIFLSFFMNIIGYWYSDKIALRMAHAEPIDLVKDIELKRMVENIAITAGLPMPKVYIIRDPAPNAFATGRNKHHSAIAVTSGLLSMLDRAELEGVIAHEMAHIGNRDTLLATVVVILVGLLSIASDMFVRTSIFGGRDSDNKAGGILAIIGVILLILSPIIGTIIQLAISRRREFLADATAALLTRYPEGLANALRKIENYAAHGAPLEHASDATAHMYFANPFGPSKMLKGVHKLFMTHPPTEERIKALLGGRKE
ncbi:MAG: M48 family metallopeptidase [Candidatus Taylorbacteria bacterium]|nr:M48 family metallopeptidase [Candidatus Taylorbacteria bacterium]